MVLKHLQNDRQNQQEEYFETHVWKVVRERGYHRDEIREKVQVKTPEEIIKETEEIKNISAKLYYDINKEKIDEIEKAFRNEKQKVMLKNAKKLSNGKIFTTEENKIMIFDIKKYEKLYKIEIEDSSKIVSVIELDNEDLIILTQKQNENKDEYYQLLCYRLKDHTYSLFQKIKDWYHVFKQKIIYDSHDYPIFEQSNLIKKLSNNKFLFFSKSQNKMYYLNEKNEYIGRFFNKKSSLFETFDLDDDSDGFGWRFNSESIQDVYEIDNNNFIFFVDKGLSKGDECLNRRSYLYKSKFL